MSAESKKLRRMFIRCSTEDYLKALKKVDYIQSKRPWSYKNINKSDEYKLYWEQIFKHCPADVRGFLEWDVDKLIRRVMKVVDRKADPHDEEGWGDSYDIDEKDLDDSGHKYDVTQMPEGDLGLFWAGKCLQQNRRVVWKPNCTSY